MRRPIGNILTNEAAALVVGDRPGLEPNPATLRFWAQMQPEVMTIAWWIVFAVLTSSRPSSAGFSSCCGVIPELPQLKTRDWSRFPEEEKSR